VAPGEAAPAADLTQLRAADPIRVPAVDRGEAAEEVRAGVLVLGEVIAVAEGAAVEALLRLHHAAVPAAAGDTERVALGS
jgi:hypothetical protein